MRCFVRLLALALLGFPPSSAETHIVRPDGSGDFPTIQAAVDAAQDGDTIMLMNGVFQGEGNRDIFIYDKEISIRSQWLDPTVCTVDCAGGGGTVCGFIFWGGEGTPSLKGVTITNATASGIRIYGGEVVVDQCNLRGNSASQGGGMYVDYLCYPWISRCTFAENEAGSGGGMCI